MAEGTTEEASPRATLIGVRWLKPDTTGIFEGSYSLLHCSVKNDALYRGVFAVRMFPVTYPDGFISLGYTDTDEKLREIGVIENLWEFPPEQQALVRASLDRHYHEPAIRRVYGVKLRYGQLFFDVETERGRESFILPWRGDRAEDFGERGKLLLDVFDNRYVIPDVQQLSPADRSRFTKYVYW